MSDGQSRWKIAAAPRKASDHANDDNDNDVYYVLCTHCSFKTKAQNVQRFKQDFALHQSEFQPPVLLSMTTALVWANTNAFVALRS